MLKFEKCSPKAAPTPIPPYIPPPLFLYTTLGVSQKNHVFFKKKLHFSNIAQTHLKHF